MVAKRKSHQHASRIIEMRDMHDVVEGVTRVSFHGWFTVSGSYVYCASSVSRALGSQPLKNDPMCHIPCIGSACIRYGCELWGVLSYGIKTRILAVEQMCITILGKELEACAIAACHKPCCVIGVPRGRWG